MFGNFVPNYKSLASIAQMFSQKMSPKNSVILENQIIKNMTLPQDKQESLQPIDKILIHSL